MANNTMVVYLNFLLVWLTTLLYCKRWLSRTIIHYYSTVHSSHPFPSVCYWLLSVLLSPLSAYVASSSESMMMSCHVCQVLSMDCLDWCYFHTLISIISIGWDGYASSYFSRVLSSVKWRGEWIRFCLLSDGVHDASWTATAVWGGVVVARRG